MKRITECDVNALYIALDKIGIKVEDLNMETITPEYLQDLYRYLLQMQLVAWKAGKSYRQLIRETNLALHEKKPVIKKDTLLR